MLKALRMRLNWRKSCRFELDDTRRIPGLSLELKWITVFSMANETHTQALPEGVRRGNEQLIVLTPAAGKKIVALIERDNEGLYLRIAITGGGCNGLSYKMKFVNDLRKGDIVVASAGAEVVVDSKSALYLKGTQLDYSDKMVAGGFKFSNPNAKSSCSCGESFSI